MTFWDRWLRRPQGLWLRKAIFQIHLWTGIGLGIYVVLISVSGSAIVFRNELYKSLWPPPKLVAMLRTSFVAGRTEEGCASNVDEILGELHL